MFISEQRRRARKRKIYSFFQRASNADTWIWPHNICGTDLLFLLSWQYKRDVLLFVYRAMREFCFIRCTLCKCENTLRFGNVIARFTDTPTMTYRTVKFYSRLFAYDLSFATLSFSLSHSSSSPSSSSSSSFLPISLFREYFILVRMICRKSVSFSTKLNWINGIQHFPNQTMCWYVICRCPAILSWILLHVAQRMLFFRKHKHFHAAKE